MIDMLINIDLSFFLKDLIIFVFVWWLILIKNIVFVDVDFCFVFKFEIFVILVFLLCWIFSGEWSNKWEEMFLWVMVICIELIKKGMFFVMILIIVCDDC